MTFSVLQREAGHNDKNFFSLIFVGLNFFHNSGSRGVVKMDTITFANNILAF